MKKLMFVILLIISLTSAKAQYSTQNAHSHNDYEQKTPFFLAYGEHFGSIEADIWVVEGELFVAHDKDKITPERSLDALYLNPIVSLFKKNDGKAWSNYTSTFQLLIDLKTGVEPTLSLLVKKLKKYPGVFDPKVNQNAVRIVITGNRPDPAQFGTYPDFIHFDGNLNLNYDKEQQKRVALYSENLSRFTTWEGEGAIAAKEELRLKQIIDSVHGLNKKIRFWNAPDTEIAWKILMDMKVDFINTDHIQDLSIYLNNNKNK